MAGDYEVSCRFITHNKCATPEGHIHSEMRCCRRMQIHRSLSSVQSYSEPKLLAQNLLQHTCTDLRNCRSWKAESAAPLPKSGNCHQEELNRVTAHSVISESHQWSCAQVPPANGKGTKEQKGKWRTSAVRKIFSSRYPFFKFYGLVLDTWNLSISF